MGMLDWVIVGGLFLLLLITAIYSQRYTRSVADFLAASRCAGRYLITVCGGMAALSATMIIASCEGVFSGGLTNTWWNMGQGLIVSIVLVSGWIVYRYRQTRALTLAQFLEVRYSRKFRIFSGTICWLAGIVNFGIFPSVGARFFMSALQIPSDAAVAGMPVYMLLLLILIAIPMAFTLFGGQITVMVTDFVQGIFCSIMMLVLIIASVCIIGMPAISQTLLDGISRGNKERIEQAAAQVSAGIPVSELSFGEDNPKTPILSDALADAVVQGAQDPEELTAAATAYYQANDSMIHPMKIKGKRDLNIWFYLMSFWLIFYSGRIWQGSQGYNASALTPHEARMGNVLAPLRILPQTVFCIVMPVCALAWFNSEAFASGAGGVKEYLIELGNPHLQRQMSTPLAMMQFLPVGLRGSFVALMLAALISTFDSYLHSWGSIFIQDVVMPFRKEPFSQKAHLRLLRISVIFVGLFIFVFSMIFRQTEYIVMFWNITGAIFTGGAGAVVIGGLYWKRGSTAGAWSALITGSTLAVGGILLRQIQATHPFENPVLAFVASKNGMVLAFWSGLIAMAVYAAVSLLSRQEPFNMDKMLHRGKYVVKEDEHNVAEKPVKGLRALIGMNNEFSKGDRVVYIFSVCWMLVQVSVFALGTLYNSIVKVSDASWLVYWKYHVGAFLLLGCLVAVWFTIGGINDVIKMFKRLSTMQRNTEDDGMVDSQK